MEIELTDVKSTPLNAHRHRAWTGILTMPCRRSWMAHLHGATLWVMAAFRDEICVESPPPTHVAQSLRRRRVWDFSRQTYHRAKLTRGM